MGGAALVWYSKPMPPLPHRRCPLFARAALVLVPWLAGGCAEASTRAAPVPTPRATPPGSAVACARVRAGGDAPLIDDFEADAGRLPTNDGRGGFWFDYDDGTRGNFLREEVDLSAAGGTGRALHVAAPISSNGAAVSA
jgi:hypothetical protein